MIIYLVRHGQTTGDVEDRYGGDYDDHLTELGKQQSADMAKRLTLSGIEAVYSSPKIRARETADIIKEAISVPLVIARDFRERNRYGILTGLTKQEAAQKYPDQVKLLAEERSTVGGGEDYRTFGQRITSVLNKVTGNKKYKTVAVVTHGGPIRYIFREILKEGEIEISDCAYAKLRHRDGTISVLELNGISIQS